MRIHHLWRAVPLALIVLTTISTALVAQDERESVLKTVQRFFDAMASRDTVMAQEAMLVDGISFSTTQTPDGPRCVSVAAEEFSGASDVPEDGCIEKVVVTVLRDGAPIHVLETLRTGEESFCS